MSKRFMLAASFVALCGSLGTVTPSAQSTPGLAFTFRQLEPAGDPAAPNYPVTLMTSATGINNRNEVVGHDNGFNGVFYSPDGGVLETFKAPGAVFTDFPFVLPAQVTVVYKMNDLGATVGYKRENYSFPAQGFVRSPTGVFSRITAPNGEFTDLVEGLGINNYGHIVGTDSNTGDNSWLLSGGRATLINIPVVGGTRSTQVTDINDFSDRVGRYLGADGLRHGYYQTGPTIAEVTNIDHPLAAPGQTYPMGLNNAGQVVGWYFNTTDVGNFRHGFLWQAGQFTSLDYQGVNPLGFNGRDTIPNDINGAGMVVGETRESIEGYGFIGGHAWIAIPHLVVTPTNADQCRNGGWSRFESPRRFKNQGDCIQFVNTGR